jgi:hypothetical protein
MGALTQLGRYRMSAQSSVQDVAYQWIRQLTGPEVVQESALVEIPRTQAG